MEAVQLPAGVLNLITGLVADAGAPLRRTLICCTLAIRHASFLKNGPDAVA